ncbi:hypothetical protein ACRAWD_27420 [Caulobacter segnis]
MVAVFDLKRRNESNANYDLIGRYYYLWPDNAACREEVHDRLNGVARITRGGPPTAACCARSNCAWTSTWQTAMSDTPNRFSKLVTLVGADTSRFAATLTDEAGAHGLLRGAFAHSADRAAGPADERNEIVNDRNVVDSADEPSPPRARPYSPDRRQFFDRRLGRCLLL